MTKRSGPDAGLSRDVLKLLALGAMTLNHISVCFVPGGILHEILLDIGYLTAPVMVFFLAEGYRHTSSLRRYAMRLLIFGILSEIPYLLTVGTGFNMMFSLFFCLMILTVSDRVNSIYLKVPLLVLLSACCLFSDWTFYAPVMAVLFRRAGDDLHEQSRVFALTGLLFFADGLVQYSGLGPVPAAAAALGNASGIALSALLILFCYKKNGKRSAALPGSEPPKRMNRYIFYCYYPLHLTALFLITYFMNR